MLVHGIQMLSGLYVDCFGDSLVEDVGVLVHDTGCSGTSVGIHVVKEHNCPQTFTHRLSHPKSARERIN